MLAAFVTVPNPPQNEQEASPATQTFRALPTPENWRGVGQGLSDASGLLRLRLYAQAEDELLQLLEFAPMEGKAWHMLGRCHQIQGRHAKALECFERAACCYNTRGLQGDAQPASARLARLLWDQGEASAARDMLAQLLAERPGDAALLGMQNEWLGAQAVAAHPDTQEPLA